MSVGLAVPPQFSGSSEHCRNHWAKWPVITHSRAEGILLENCYHKYFTNVLQNNELHYYIVNVPVLISSLKGITFS